MSEPSELFPVTPAEPSNVQTAAYGIVLASTASHAYWNFLLKRSRGGTTFVGLSKLAEVVLVAPVFIWIVARTAVPEPGAAGLVAVGAALVLLNYVSLARAYRAGDLSLVYPISRAGILFFLPIFGFLVFGERLTTVGWIALVVIVLGILALQLPALSWSSIATLAPMLRTESVAFALAAALFAAIYTVWDKRAIRELSPFLYFYSYTALVAVAYAGYLWRTQSRADVQAVWRTSWSSIVQVGFFNTVTYLLVLLALRGETSSYVVALRQLSIVWSVLLGKLLLGEVIALPKRIGITMLLAGCALVAFTR